MVLIASSREFDGIDDVIAGTITAMDTGDWTIGAWVNPDAGFGEGGAPRVMSIGGIQEMILVTATARLAVNQTFTTNARAQSNDNAMTTGEWQCVFGTFIASSATIKLYRGTLTGAMVELSLAINDAGLITRGTNGTLLKIGNNAATDRTLDGRIAFPLIQKRLMSLAEMEAFRQGNLSMAVAPSGTQWHLFATDSPTDSTVIDLSPNRVAMTVTGATAAEGPPVALGFLPTANVIVAADINVIDASASLSGTGSLSVVGLQESSGVAPLSGTSSEIIVGLQESSGISALSGIGSQVIDSLNIPIAAAGIEGGGNLSASAIAELLAAGALVGLGDLSTASVSEISALASISGAGSLSAATLSEIDASATLTGAGSSSTSSSVLVYASATLIGTGDLTATATLAQCAFPDADVTDGSWTDQSNGTNLSAAIDESTPSDADFIRGPLTILAITETCEVSLGSLTDPTESTGHVIFYRYAKSASGGQVVDLTVALYQGTTQIASFTHTNIGNTFTTVDQTLTGPQADSITDYTDLRLRFSQITAIEAINTRRAQVSWARLCVPAQGVAVAQGAAALSGAGSASISAMQLSLAAAGIDGGGDLSAAAIQAALAVGAMAGSGTQTIAATGVPTAASTLTGTSTFTADSVSEIPAAASLSGLGDLSADAFVVSTAVLAAAILTGSGTLAATALVLVQASSGLSGLGLLIALAQLVDRECEVGDTDDRVLAIGSVGDRLVTIGSVSDRSC